MDASYIMNDYMDKVAMGATGIHGFDKIEDIRHLITNFD